MHHLTFTTDASSIFPTYLSADVSCEFDFYDASSKQWFSGGSVALGASATTFKIVDISASATLRFPSGQMLGAVICD